MTLSREVELESHIIDSGTMGTAFSIVMDMREAFTVEAVDIGRRKDEASYARLLVEADDEATLWSMIHELHQHGANPVDPTDATLARAPADRVVPDGFYSTTNHPTFVRYDGAWLPVERMEMDCAIVVERGASDGGPRAYTTVRNAVEAGDRIVTVDADSTASVLATATPEPMAGGRRIERFSCAWRETEESFGGGVALANSDGQLELFVGSNNPEWAVLTDTEEPRYSEIESAEGYERWIRTDVAFNWSDSRATVTFTDTTTDTTASESFDLGQGTDVETIELRGFTVEEVERGDGIETRNYKMYWDELLVTP